MIECKFICDKCKKEKVVSKINEYSLTIGNEYVWVYLPKGWKNYRKGQICPRCINALIKLNDNFLEIKIDKTEKTFWSISHPLMPDKKENSFWSPLKADGKKKSLWWPLR